MQKLCKSWVADQLTQIHQKMDKGNNRVSQVEKIPRESRYQLRHKAGGKDRTEEE